VWRTDIQSSGRENFMPIFLTNIEQEQCITPIEAVDALQNGLRQFAIGDGIRRPRIDNILPTERPGEWFNFSSMEGGIRDPGYYALRIKPDIYASTPDRFITYSYKPGLYGGMVFLYSTENAEFLALMNDGYVQHLRVAASASLGIKFLSRPESSELGIIGSGGMARFFAMTVPTVRPIKRIRVWSTTRANLDAYVSEMRKKLDIEIMPVDGVEAVMKGADIVCSCTTSRLPTIKVASIEPGMHINHVTHNELGHDVLARIDTVGLLVRRTPMKVTGYVDDGFTWTSNALCYLGGQPEERALYPTGKPNPNRYKNAHLVDCINWRTGEIYRRRPDEVTLLANASYGTLEGEALVSAGTQGIQFASVAGRIFENAKRKGVGTALPAEMFLQDIPS
jgi:ornithine cyclodeaminase/alanine dehydrogenase-like protein (mu-crystallin family)